MRFLILILSFLTVTASQATSPYRGPYLYKAIGSNSCNIKPGSVTLIQDDFKQSFSIPSGLRLSHAKLKDLIKKANLDRMKKIRTYVRAMNPPTSIGAGLAPELSSFEIYKNASNLSLMEGEAAQFLIKYVETLCVDLKTPPKK